MPIEALCKKITVKLTVCKMNHSIKTEMIMQIRSFEGFGLIQNNKITKFEVIAMFSETSLDQQRKLSDRNRYIFQGNKKV